MDNQAYLIKRGWRISKNGRTWVDPQDDDGSVSLFLALQIQMERDAEQLDIVTARVAELQAALTAMLNQFDMGPQPDREAIYTSQAMGVIKQARAAIGGQPNASKV